MKDGTGKTDGVSFLIEEAGAIVGVDTVVLKGGTEEGTGSTKDFETKGTRRARARTTNTTRDALTGIYWVVDS